MVPQESVLVMVVRLVDRIPLPPPAPTRPRGRPRVYSDRLFLKALVIMIVRGFIEPIAKELPLEYALELNRLIQLEMEGSVG